MKVTLLNIILFICFSELSMAQRMPNFIPYREGDKWGFCDSNKKILIQPQWKEVKLFSDGLAAVLLNNKYGYIDTTGKLVIPYSYRWAYEFLNGYATVGFSNTTFGVINKLNSKIFSTKFYGEFGADYSNGLFFTWTYTKKHTQKSGVYNTKGEIVIPFNYSTIQKTTSDRYFIIMTSKWKEGDDYDFRFGLFDIISNKEIVKCTFNSDTSIEFRGILNKYGIKSFVEENPQRIINGYHGENEFNCGAYKIIQDSINLHWGIFDILSKNITGSIYVWVNCGISENTFIVERNDQKVGVIDNNLKTIIPFEYGAIFNLDNGLYSLYIDLKNRNILLGYSDRYYTKYWND